MAHGVLSNSDAIYSENSAWHKRGTVSKVPLTPTQAFDAVLNWKVGQSFTLTGIFDQNENDKSITSGWKMLRREDTGNILGIVQDSYEVVQNDVLLNIAQQVVDGTKYAIADSAMALWGGKKVILTLRGNSVDVGGKGDIVDHYAVIASSHDYSLPLMLLPTTVRVVCQNTLTAALRSSDWGSGFRLRHTANLGTEEGAEMIENAIAAWKSAESQITKNAEILASVKLNREQIQDLWTEVYAKMFGEIPTTSTTRGDKIKRDNAVNAMGSIAKIFDVEAQKFGPTAWVAANAVTNWIQNVRKVRKDSQDARADAELFGTTGDRTRLVMDTALALV